jgi:hypothetical protein
MNGGLRTHVIWRVIRYNFADGGCFVYFKYRARSLDFVDDLSTGDGVVRVSNFVVVG